MVGNIPNNLVCGDNKNPPNEYDYETLQSPLNQYLLNDNDNVNGVLNRLPNKTKFTHPPFPKK